MVHGKSKPNDFEGEPKKQKTSTKLAAVRSLSPPLSATPGGSIEDEADVLSVHQDDDLESQPRSEDGRHPSDSEHGGSPTRESSGGSIASSTGTVETPRKRKHFNLELALQQLDDHFGKLDKKMHRFPRSLWPLHKEYYSTPQHVPIGPYHDHLHYKNGKHSMIRKLKNVSAHHFVSDTNFGSFEDMKLAFYDSGAGDARSFFFFDEHVQYTDDRRYHMLRDGCFLLQYMDFCTRSTCRNTMPPSLVSYFDSNQVVIDHDIMLLENQLPWEVIQTLRSFMKVSVDVEQFIAKMARTLQLRKGNDKKNNPLDLLLDGSYKPPHLLGAVRFYKIGGGKRSKNNNEDEACNYYYYQFTKRFSLLLNYCCCYYSSSSSSGLPTSSVGRTRTISKSVSAIELAEIGIKLTVSKTASFTDMGIKKRLFCTEIFLPPLLLDETRLCWLINMVAFELCVAATFRSSADKDDVCSYLLVLAMLMDREEDVHKLRSKGIVQGELTNKETLDFFKDLVKHVSGGPLYLHLMEEIEDYRLNRWMWIKVHKFIYKNYKIIATTLSIIGVLVGIFKTLFSLKQH